MKSITVALFRAAFVRAQPLRPDNQPRDCREQPENHVPAFSFQNQVTAAPDYGQLSRLEPLKRDLLQDAAWEIGALASQDFIR